MEAGADPLIQRSAGPPPGMLGVGCLTFLKNVTFHVRRRRRRRFSLRFLLLWLRSFPSCFGMNGRGRDAAEAVGSLPSAQFVPLS